MEFAFHVSPLHRSVCVSQGYLKFFELLFFYHIILTNSYEQVALSKGAPFMMFFSVGVWTSWMSFGEFLEARVEPEAVIKHYLWNSNGTPTREKWDNSAEIRRAKSNVFFEIFTYISSDICGGCSTKKNKDQREKIRSHYKAHTWKLKMRGKMSNNSSKRQRPNRK